MDNQTKKTLEQLTQKATQRLRDKKKVKFKTLFVPSLDEEIKIRNLTKEEITEVLNIEDEIMSDVMTAYYGVVDLKDVAKALKEQGEITEYTEVTNIFNMQERNQIVRKILELSDVTSEKKVEVVENLKN
ncbi:MAG: hypothetical protein KGV59_07720 [Tenacibaculum sp.]|nr:hypothetical protein [Tenacibaculum sp.]